MASALCTIVLFLLTSISSCKSYLPLRFFLEFILQPLPTSQLNVFISQYLEIAKHTQQRKVSQTPKLVEQNLSLILSLHMVQLQMLSKNEKEEEGLKLKG